jgi:ribonuclease HI
MERTLIAADGSAAGNPGPGGWAWYVNDDHWSAGGEPGTTNNRMEISAVIDAISANNGALHILCDSRYVVDAATGWMRGWKRRGWCKADGTEIKNRDLFERLDSVLAGRDVVFEWVRGHNGHVLNEAADVRARSAAEAVRDRREIRTGPASSAA